MHWDPANVALTLMLVLLFVIFLLLFLTLTAPPAMGQTYQVRSVVGSQLSIAGCHLPV